MHDPRFSLRGAIKAERRCVACGRMAPWTFAAKGQEYRFCAKHAEELDARLTQYHRRFGGAGR